MATQRNILVRLWLGFWRGVTALRMAVFNIVFLLAVALIIGLIIRGGDKLVIEKDTTLVLAPVGLIVEEFSGSAIERAVQEALGQGVQETRKRDLLAVLEQAAADDRITQVLINTDRLVGVGAGSMREINEAFGRFRESGKPIIAYGGFMTQGQYFLASLADEIWLDHEGAILIEGYSRFRNYYREGLDRIGVEVNLFQTGDFKSAMEPWSRSDMSEADREASLHVLDDLWQEYLDAVASNRGMTVETLLDLVENFTAHVAEAEGNLAELALEKGLVDRLVSRPELRAELAQRGAPDDNGSFRQVAHSDFLKLPARKKPTGDQVAVIVAEGPITEGNQPPGTIGSESTSRKLRQAAQDNDVKAVVLRVNSGGGSAFASEIIRQEMVALRDAGKPVVVSMGNVAASGGYVIAMGADEVWANPTTITGSIGVIGFFPTFEETLSRIGIHTDGVGTTPLAGALRVDRSLNVELRNILNVLIDASYLDFLTLVAEHRQMSVDAVHEVAQGRIWTGAQALELGLVDQLGGLEEAVASAARLAGLGDDFHVTYVEPELSGWQKFLADLSANALLKAGLEPEVTRLFKVLPAGLRQSIAADLQLVFEATRSGRPGIMAHCLCEAPM